MANYSCTNYIDLVDVKADLGDTCFVTSAGKWMRLERLPAKLLPNWIHDANIDVDRDATQTDLDTLEATVVTEQGYIDALQAQIVNAYASIDALQLVTPIQSVVDDTSPELGGELDANAHSIVFTPQLITGDGLTTIDWTKGNKVNFTFGNTNETFAFTPPSNAAGLTLLMHQYTSGSNTATFPATVKWAGAAAPTLTTFTNATDMISFYYDKNFYYGAATLNLTTV